MELCFPLQVYIFYRGSKTQIQIVIALKPTELMP